MQTMQQKTMRNLSLPRLPYRIPTVPDPTKTNPAQQYLDCRAIPCRAKPDLTFPDPDCLASP
jgi:hypothetical protein